MFGCLLFALAARPGCATVPFSPRDQLVALTIALFVVVIDRANMPDQKGKAEKQQYLSCECCPRDVLKAAQLIVAQITMFAVSCVTVTRRCNMGLTKNNSY